MIERNAMAFRHNWMVIFSGFVEPVLYLLGIGFGIGSLVRTIPIGDGHTVSYAVFVAPALMASSAMNGAIYESTFNLFYKLRYARTFEAVISTPVGVEDATLGEVMWAIGRGSLYSVGFVIVMLALGLVASPWAILAVPASILVGFAFAALGAALTTFVRQWQDLDIIQLALQPMFLFSATFFPVTVYPPALRLLVEWTPLYRGIDLVRGLTTGGVGPGLLGDVAYLAVMGLIGVTIAALRLRSRLLK
ncbi:MAG: ABC transporter [Chloroflexi bacterium]|nr:MAG: ABC transporter [Chloroflexota bacterium]